MRISASLLFGSDEIEKAVRIIKSLISQKYITKAQDSEAESRIDYLADILGISKKEIISVVERMRQEGILADSKDISAYLQDTGDSERKSQVLLERFAKLERYILNHIPDESLQTSYKQLMIMPQTAESIHPKKRIFGHCSIFSVSKDTSKRRRRFP